MALTDPQFRPRGSIAPEDRELSRSAILNEDKSFTGPRVCNVEEGINNLFDVAKTNYNLALKIIADCAHAVDVPLVALDGLYGRIGKKQVGFVAVNEQDEVSFGVATKGLCKQGGIDKVDFFYRNGGQGAETVFSNYGDGWNDRNEFMKRARKKFKTPFSQTPTLSGEFGYIVMTYMQNIPK